MRILNTNRKYVLFSCLFLAPTYVFAQANFVWFESVITGINTALGTLIPALIALALAVFIWGLVKFIWNSGDDSAKQDGKNKMIWGVLALFIIVSIWGIIALLNTIFGVTSVATPPSTPTL